MNNEESTNQAFVQGIYDGEGWSTMPTAAEIDRKSLIESAVYGALTYVPTPFGILVRKIQAKHFAEKFRIREIRNALNHMAKTGRVIYLSKFRCWLKDE
jgi:hypothetical protein